MAKLVFQDPKTGQMRHVTLSFIGGPVSVGRNKSNVVAIKHRSISRYHGRFRFENGDHYYDDLKSSNGSFFENERVTTVKLDDGAQLKLGDVNVEFSIKKMPTLELLPIEAPAEDDSQDESTYTIDLPDHMRRDTAEHGDMTFVPGLSGVPSRDLETLKERAIERAQVNRPWENDQGPDEAEGLEEHTYTADALDLSNFPEDAFEEEPPKGLTALLEQAGTLEPEPEPEPEPTPAPALPKPTTGGVLGRIKLRSFKAARELETQSARPEPVEPKRVEPKPTPPPVRATAGLPAPPPIAPVDEVNVSKSAEIEPFSGLEESSSLSTGGRLGASVDARLGESPEDIAGPATSVLKIDPIAAANAWIKSTSEGAAAKRPTTPEVSAVPDTTSLSDLSSSEDVEELKARISELEMRISELELERDNAREIADVVRRNAARLIEALED